MEFFIAIAVFIGVVAVTALLFSGWAVVAIVKAVAAGINSLIAPPRQASRFGPGPFTGRTGPSLDGVRCMRARCFADNPAGARFCRKCGTSLAWNRTSPPPYYPRQVGNGSGRRVTL